MTLNSCIVLIIKDDLRWIEYMVLNWYFGLNHLIWRKIRFKFKAK